MSQDASRDALVVGINTYKYPRFKPLKTPSENAEAIAQRLTEYGNFRVKRIPELVQPDNSLRVGGKTAVSLKQLKKAIEQLFMPEGGNIPDTALLFFSGHGLRDDSRIKQGYLATSDVNPDDEKWGLPLPWLRKLLEKSPIKQQIVWLDCCYSGELFNFDDDPKEVDPGNQKNSDRCLITASRGFEVAYEQASGIHGVLTGALLKGLDPRERPDGWVTTHTLADFINKELKTETQRPLCHNSGSPIILTTCKPKSLNSPDEGICPYKGLEYFKQEDAQFFWGRTALTDELIEKVRTENFVAVLGASGSGKSSVLRAGLLHQLNLGIKLTGSDCWQIYQPFTPGEHPSQSLEAVIGRAANELNQLVTEAETNRVVLVVDQFEECFTLCQDSREREQFFDCLLSAVEREDNKLCLVLGMRADFLGKSTEYAGLANKIDKHLVTVKPMTPKELKEAIIQPAEKVGLQVEPQLVTRMIEDVADSPGSLPLLQYTLMELWKARQKPVMNWLTLFYYERLGGDKGGIKGILEKRANEVYQSLNEEEKPIAQRIFLELTQVGEVADTHTRRRARKKDLINSQHSEALLDGVIRKLAEARLITTTEAGLITTSAQSKSQDLQLTQTDASIPKKLKPDVVIDITHEALIRHWEQLRNWVEDYRVPLEIERRIEADAKEWTAKGKPEGLLLREGRLVEAEDYQRVYLNLGFLDGIAQEFIEESIKLSDRTQRRKFIINTGVSTALSILAGAAGLGWWFSEVQRRQTITSLTAASQELFESNKDFEALLTSLNAAKQVKQATFGVNSATKFQVQVALQQAVYGVKERNRLEGHEARVASVSFSPDGQLLASSSSDRTIKLWDFTTGKEIKTLTVHGDTVDFLTFNPDGRLLASASWGDKTVKLWDVATGKEIATFKDYQADTSGNNGVSFSPDGTLLAFASEGNTIQIWGVATRQQIATLSGHDGRVNSVSFSPDGRMLASGSFDNKVKLWNVATRKEIPTPFKHTSWVYGVSFSPDGRLLASGSDDGTIKLWDVARRKEFSTLSYPGRVTSVSFSRDGQLLVAGGFNNIAKLWDVATSTEISTLYGHRLNLTGVSLSPDRQWVASASEDHTIKLWYIARRKEINTFLGHSYRVWSVSFSPDGRMLATASNDTSIKLWNVSTSREIATLGGHKSGVYGVSVSPDGRRLASASWDGTAKLWDISTGTEISTLSGHKLWVITVSFSPDGKLLASGSWDSTVKLWDAASGKELTSLTGHKTEVLSVSFSPDGRLLASASGDKTIKLWDVATRHEIATLTGHKVRVNSVSFSPDGRLLASGTDRTIKLWDVTTRREIGTLNGHSGNVNSVSFSPDGRLLASAGDDKSIIIWDVANRKKINVLNGHRTEINSVSFSPDGQLLASGSANGTVILWNYNILSKLTFDDLLARGCDWVRGYLQNNPNVSDSERRLCDGIGNGK